MAHHYEEIIDVVQPNQEDDEAADSAHKRDKAQQVEIILLAFNSQNGLRFFGENRIKELCGKEPFQYGIMIDEQFNPLRCAEPIARKRSIYFPC